MLTWVLALSWVPLLVGAMVAAAMREPWMVLVIGVVMIAWIMKLCDIFDMIESRKP
jgi:hypothetical protein